VVGVQAGDGPWGVVLGEAVQGSGFTVRPPLGWASARAEDGSVSAITTLAAGAVRIVVLPPTPRRGQGPTLAELEASALSGRADARVVSRGSGEGQEGRRSLHVRVRTGAGELEVHEVRLTPLTVVRGLALLPSRYEAVQVGEVAIVAPELQAMLDSVRVSSSGAER
jgi:hypothetical protein